MAETIQDRGFDVKRSQTMHPGSAGTADKACAFVDEALAEIKRLRAVIQHESDCVEAAKAEIERQHEALKVADAVLCQARTFIASRADGGWAWLDQSRATIRAAISSGKQA